MITEEVRRTGITDITKIEGIAEQQFFTLLRRKLPIGTQIIYEDCFFKQQDDNGKEQGTTPDFHVIKPNGTEFFVEITTEAFGSNGNDPKGEAKRIMSETLPVKKYTVLYREHLQNIQKHYPEFSFFNGKKIKKNGQQLTLEIIC